MKKIYFKNLNEYFNKKITVEGFVDNIRDLQYVQFLVIRDTTGKIQVTIEKNENNSKLNEIISNLTIESTVKITGTLLKNEKVKLNGMELIPTDIIVTSKCLEELPLNYKDSKSALLDTRLNYRFLDLTWFWSERVAACDGAGGDAHAESGGGTGGKFGRIYVS